MASGIRMQGGCPGTRGSGITQGCWSAAYRVTTRKRIPGTYRRGSRSARREAGRDPASSLRASQKLRRWFRERKTVELEDSNLPPGYMPAHVDEGAGGRPQGTL